MTFRVDFFFQTITVIINSLCDLNAKCNEDDWIIFLLKSYVRFLTFHKYGLEKKKKQDNPEKNCSNLVQFAIFLLVNITFFHPNVTFGDKTIR